MILCRFPLLKRGITLAILRSDGKIPEYIHSLNSCAKTGAIACRTCLIALTHRSDDLLLLKPDIIFTISSGSMSYSKIELHDRLSRKRLKSSGEGGESEYLST